MDINKILFTIRWWIIYAFMTKKERALIQTIVKDRTYWAINHYADCMGETFHEYINELMILKQKVK